MRRSKKRNNTDSLEEPIINLTPLIDVVFVVLIIFMILAPMLELDKIELAPGGIKSEDLFSSEESPIMIHVHKDNSIWLNRYQVNIQQLKSLLHEAKKRYPQEAPQLFHDRYAQFGIYQEVKNAVEAAGFEKMDVVLKPA
jgi:biopolymer transport protein ExbD